MALKSNRVGVRTDQVDVYGRITSKSFLQSILDHLPRWTSLKVWKNGTEQLLPVNTDVPVTSPIVADIQYPTDSSATEQMFTYRVSPTEVDGEAYIQSIKGNTIVWNQQINNGNFSETTGWSSSRCTFTVSGNVATITPTDETGGNIYTTENRWATTIAGHKYLCLGSIKGDGTNTARIRFYLAGVRYTEDNTTSTWKDCSFIVNCADNNTYGYVEVFAVGSGTIQVKNVMLIDLTKMFGSTKADEIYAMETAQTGSGVDYFRSLFPLPYYQYDAGSLLSFNGTGIKTVGFNQWDEEWDVGGVNSSGNNYTSTDRIRSKNYIPVFLNANYFLKAPENLIIRGYDKNQVFVTSLSGEADRVLQIPENVSYIRFMTNTSYGVEYKKDICINISSSENGKYEPYTTSTTTIPTDTYFPTGMKSAGTVYDEFVSSRAYTRIGEVDLGTLTWTYNSTYQAFYATGIKDLAKRPQPNEVPNMTSIYTPRTMNSFTNPVSDMSVYYNTLGDLWLRNLAYDDETDFTTAMDGVMLQYELAEEIIEPTLEFDEE